MSDWFEVFAGGAILFCGPLKACEAFAAENFPAATIRPISF